MAEFCTKCFSALNENGQCPICGWRAADVAVAAPAAPVATVVAQPVYAAAPVAPKFCMKCGGSLDENGSCPICDAPPAPVAVAQFCMKCGGPLDENGSCPVCDAPPAPVAVAQFCMKCGGSLDENGSCPVCDAAPAEEVVAPVAEAIVEPKAKKKNSPLTVIATVLLSICLFITMLLSVSIATVRNTVSKGGIANLTEELDIALLLEESGAANSKAMNTFYDRLERDYGIEMDDEKLAEMVEESSLPEYISDKVDDFTDDFFKGDAELVITKEEMIDLVRENAYLLEEEIPDGFDRDLSYEDYEHIANWLFNEDELVLVSTDNLKDSAPTLYRTATIGLSYVALAFFLLLSALIIFVMCRNSLSQAAIGGGVVFLLLGGLTAVAAAMVAWIPGLWNDIAGGKLVLSVVGSVLATNGWIFGILLFLGISMLVIRAIVKHAKNKKA